MRLLLFISSTSLILLGDLFANNIEENLTLSSKTIEKISNEEAMLEMLGYMTVFRNGLKEMGFGKDHSEAIARGLKKGLEDEEISASMLERMPEFQVYIQEKFNSTEKVREETMAEQLKANIAAGKDFIEGLSIDEMVKSTPSGLHYKILDQGNENYAKLKDTVRVHYKGTRIDGTVFDSSYSRGNPVDFPLKGVVPGFAEGLTKIGEGGSVILFIPSDLAYGDNPRQGGVIQPGDTLIFECELIKINP